METGAAADGPAPKHTRAPETTNRVSVLRAHLKRRVAAGELNAAEVILAHPWTVESMRLAELLICQTSWGHTCCRTFLEFVGLDESKTLRALSERQRVSVAVALSTKPLPQTTGGPSRS